MIFIIVGPVFNSFRNDASADSVNKVMEMYIRGTTNSSLEFRCPDVSTTSTTEGYIKLKLDVSQLLAALATLKSVVTPDPVGSLDDGTNLLQLPVGFDSLDIKMGRNRFTTRPGKSMAKQEVTVCHMPARMPTMLSTQWTR